MSGNLKRNDSKAVSSIIAHLDQVRSNRPTTSLTEGKSAKTGATLINIISAAREIFVNEGHASLSLRKVARKADIAVGNLTYHFPTKHILLDAMLREALAEYAEDHLAQFEADRDSPLDILLNVVTYYARNAWESHRFFYQMWGYAGSDETAMETVRNLYRPIGRFIYYLIREANPELSDHEIRRATLQLFSLEEGYKLFVGMGSTNDGALTSMEDDIRIMTKWIVFTKYAEAEA